jgi:hypothetical protein
LSFWLLVFTVLYRQITRRITNRGKCFMKYVDTVPVPKTPQELERAIQRYRSSDLRGRELFCHWQAIRLAALAQAATDVVGDQIPGEDSY